jgi:hypothetical protein
MSIRNHGTAVRLDQSLEPFWRLLGLLRVGRGDDDGRRRQPVGDLLGLLLAPVLREPPRALRNPAPHEDDDHRRHQAKPEQQSPGPQMREQFEEHDPGDRAEQDPGGLQAERPGQPASALRGG